MLSLQTLNNNYFIFIIDWTGEDITWPNPMNGKKLVFTTFFKVTCGHYGSQIQNAKACQLKY